MVSKIDISSTIATATANASQAASAAAAAAASAASNAQIAAKAAADSATAIAVVATDTSWMKKSLAGIEETLRVISSDFVSNSRFLESEKNQNDMEKRLRVIEENMWKWIGSASAIGAILTTVVSYLMKVL